jgi:exonuclease SbcC
MQITQVELKNVKSYTDSRPIRFAPGVNTISGPTGGGKSTILEAIGFALFDTLPYAQRQFLREGAKRGEIVVSFIDALDEREYQVIRPVGIGKLYVYDPEIKRQIVTGKDDVVDWLKEHLGVEPTADLSTLFTDAVGVPQGLLTAPFLERSKDRKRTFDPLLQVDDYELAWERLRETGSYLKEQLMVQERRMAELRAELKRLPRLEKEVGELQEKISADEQRLAEVVVRLEQVGGEKAALDVALDRVRELTRQSEGLIQRLEGLNRQLSVAEAEVQKAQEAQQIVEETKEGYHLYEEAQTKLSELEEQRQERDQLNAQLAEIEQALALAAQEIKRLEQTLEEITQAEKRMAELEPLVAEQEQLEKELKVAERDAERLAEARQRVIEEQTKSEKLEADLQRVQEELKTRQIVETEVDEIEQQRRDLEKQIAALEAEQGQIKGQHRQLRERLALLEQEESAACPVCRRPLEAHQAEELSEHYQAELGRLDDRAEDIRHQLREHGKKLGTTDERLVELRDQTRSLPYPGREAELAQEIGAQQGIVKEWQKKEATLARAPEQADRLRGHLKELGDPRSEYQHLKTEADKRSKAETDLAAVREARMHKEGDRKEITEVLQVFANLDDEIATQRKVMTASQANHSRYLEHCRISQTLPQRRAKIEELQTERGQVEARHEETEAELKEARVGYDEARHQELVEEHQQLTAEQAKLDERLENRREQLSNLQGEVESLRKLQTKLEEVEQEYELLNMLSEALEFIRKIIREAGPYVTRALVQTISAEADRIFGDILNDHTMRLRWEEDYGITIEQRGNERDFFQLSGGEKMAAALAVRLALLCEMSDIRIAFFDEPTAHLDDERRENLASQITQIKGFHQLFVISHDDTFERETHHVLRVSKENGVSQVEVG